jgi:lysophospholipase L1-like esterase
MPFAIKPGQTLLFVGDSITDCGRRAANAPLGSGYPALVNDLITAKYPAHRLNVINTGISGNTVRDLANRWTDDVIRYKPDWLSIKIGINDIHRCLRNVPDTAVNPIEFAELYDHILTRVKKEIKANIILVDPFYISNDDDPVSFRSLVLKGLPDYIKTVEKMAKKYKTRRVKLHEVFKTQLKYSPADRFCPEPVHPNPSGHLVMAYEWLKQMGW